MGRLTYVVDRSRSYDRRSQEEIEGVIGTKLGYFKVDFNDGDKKDLEGIASSRVKEAYRRNESSCFLEESSIDLGNDFLYIGGKFYSENKEISFEEGKEVLHRGFLGKMGVAKVVVAYTHDGESVEIFQGDVPGSIVSERGVSNTWWDTMWKPSGYKHTMKEITKFPHVMDKRTLQYLKLAEYLELPGAKDSYEAHVTVDCNGLEDWNRFSDVCDSIGIKGIQIQLPKGEFPTHLITASWHKGPFDRVKEEVYRIGEMFKQRGFNPLRHKIESMLSNSQVPKTDEEAKSRPREQYFEFHVKVSRDENEDIRALREICERYGAHLSRSASNRIGSVEQRFVTTRYRAGLDNATNLFDRMLQDLGNAGFSLSNRLKEYTVYDDNLEQDRGWAD